MSKHVKSTHPAHAPRRAPRAPLMCFPQHTTLHPHPPLPHPQPRLMLPHTTPPYTPTHNTMHQSDTGGGGSIITGVCVMHQPAHHGQR